MSLWQEIRELCTEQVSPADFLAAGKTKARVRKLFLLARETWRSIRRDNAFQMASALSYNTLLALVPMMAISLASLAMLDATQANTGGEYTLRFKAFISSHIPNATVYVFEAMDEFVKNARTIAGVGFLFLFWTAFSLLGAIERSFNVIWQVTEKRAFVARLTSFLATMIVVPILMSLSVFLTSQLATAATAAVQTVTELAPTHKIPNDHTPETAATPTSLKTKKTAAPQEPKPQSSSSESPNDQPYVVRLVLFITPIFITCLALTALYYLLPFTPVRVKAALAGGIIAGGIVELAKHGFRFYAANLTANYTHVYGPMLAFPLFLLWTWLVWIIILVGAEVAFVTQNFRDLAAKADLERRGIRSRIYLAVRIVLISSEAFHLGRSPSDLVDQATEVLRTPPYIIREILAVLVAKNILRRIAGSEDGYVPARDIGVLTVGEVERAIAVDRLDVPEVMDGLAHAPDSMRDYLAGIFQRISSTASNTLDKITFLDLVAREKAFAAAGMEHSQTEPIHSDDDAPTST